MAKIRVEALLVVATLAGCSAEDGNENHSPDQGASRGKVVFEDARADGAKFTVVEFDDGKLALSVGAPIGQELPQLSGRSLASDYLEFQADVKEMPENLRELDARVMTMKAQFISQVADLIVEEPPVLEPAPVEKSNAAFTAATCHDFVFGQDAYRVKACRHSSYASVHWCSQALDSRCAATLYDGNASNTFDGFDRLRYYDRSYHWNNTDTNGTMIWFDFYGNDYVAPSHTHLPIGPYWWSWMSVYQSDATDLQSAETVGSWDGDVGVTHHRYSFEPPK